MVQVYQQLLCRRHFASVASPAVLLRVACLLAAVALSFLLAYATGGFWRKVAHDVAQPTVHYSGDGLMILESTVPGQEQVWTTSAALASVLTTNRLSAAVQVGEEDFNEDGRPDLIRFVARVQSPVPVHSVKLLLQFSYVLQGAGHLRMHSLAYISGGSAQPGSSLSADGELLLHQSVPLRAGTALLGLEKPLLDSAALLDGSAVQGDVLQLDTLLAAYQARNVTTAYANAYPVWKGGNDQAFTIDAKIRIPPHQVYVYRPGLAEMLKWGWVQFACTFWLLHWLLAWLEGVVFHQRVLETRVVSDIQPRTQRY